MKLVATVGGKAETVDITGGQGRYRVALGDRVWDVDARFVSPTLCSLLVDGVSYVAEVTDDDGAQIVGLEGETYPIEVDEPVRHSIRTRAGGVSAAGGQLVKAPMPGKISHVAVRRGDRVERGDTLVVVEAMKMENELKAAVAGTVSDVRVTAGQPVNPGDVLVIVEPHA
jgi:biotin carboxyl carrier protein